MDYNNGSFNSRVYLQQYYETAEGHADEKLNLFFIENLMNLIELDELRNGGSLLDVGTGPSMQTTFLTSKLFDRIVLTDYCDSNRAELVKWLSKEPDAHDWSQTVKYVAQVQRPLLTPEQIEQRARSSVIACLEIDVHRRNPLEPNWMPKFDCTLSSLCLEAACSTLGCYSYAIGNLNGLLKKNGHFILMGVLGK
jgi:nicotinamide N-methyltransferase